MVWHYDKGIHDNLTIVYNIFYCLQYVLLKIPSFKQWNPVKYSSSKNWQCSLKIIEQMYY